MSAALLLKSTADVLDGLCDSMNSYVSAIMQAVSECWNTRKAEPMIIIQPAAQWQSPEPAEPPSKFPGYGDDVPPGRREHCAHTSQRRETMAGRARVRRSET